MLAEADSSGMAFLKPPKFSRAGLRDVEQRKPSLTPTHGQEAEGRQVAATRGSSSGQAGWGRSPATPNTPVLLLLHPHEGHRGLCSPPSHKSHLDKCLQGPWLEGRALSTSPGIAWVQVLRRWTLDFLWTARGICGAAWMAAGRLQTCVHGELGSFLPLLTGTAPKSPPGS